MPTFTDVSAKVDQGGGQRRCRTRETRRRGAAWSPGAVGGGSREVCLLDIAVYWRRNAITENAKGQQSLFTTLADQKELSCSQCHHVHALLLPLSE